jgi:hypothetical protein
VSKPSAFDIKTAILKINRNKSPGTGKLPADLNRHVLEKLALRSINVIYSFWNKE